MAGAEFQVVREVGVVKVESTTVTVIVVMVAVGMMGVLRMVKVVRVSMAVPVVREKQELIKVRLFLSQELQLTCFFLGFLTGGGAIGEGFRDRAVGHWGRLCPWRRRR